MTALGRVLAVPAILAACGTAVLAQDIDPPQMVRTAPKGGPNVVVILLDDVGYGTASTFGGPVPTPALDALAREGLSYTRFHTTGICSPTRVSLLTGRNPHAAGIGAVMNSADSRPGYSGFHRKDTASFVEVLRANGYATGAFGKWHQTPDWELSQAGPFDRWPTGEGFDYFYGFQGGETDQYEPTLYENTRPVARPAGKNYHLTEDLAAHSINWMRQQKSLRPDHPFFLYFSTGGIHAPIQVGAEWSAPFKGKFAQGWDRLREETFARQKAQGLFPADAQLTPRPDEIPAWDSLSPEEQRFSQRLMESYAGFMAHTDAQVGKLVAELKASGEFDNTLILYVVGDNGASLEGGIDGSLNYLAGLIGIPQDKAKMLARIDEAGTARSYSHINVGWAWAADAPFRWGKTMPSYLGAIRNPLVVSWPNRINGALEGGRRTQFGHVNDIAPTILEATGLAMPETVNGVQQKPIDGSSLIYSFADASAPEQHKTQYFEVFGTRSIYHEGWMASADHGRRPWQPPSLIPKPVENDPWTLFDLRTDWTQATDLSGANPAKLAELQALFLSEAKRNDMLPLQGMSVGKFGLPNLAAGRKSVTYNAGTRAVPEFAMPMMANTSWRIEARVDAGSKAQGVIGAVGGHSAGWSLWLDEKRRAVFTYRLFDAQLLTVRSARPIAAGARSIVVDFAYDGKGFGKGGEIVLTVDGARAGEGRLNATTPQLFTIDETFDVGIDRGSPVAAYPPRDQPGYALSDASVNTVRLSTGPQRDK